MLKLLNSIKATTNGNLRSQGTTYCFVYTYNFIDNQVFCEHFLSFSNNKNNLFIDKMMNDKKMIS